MSKEAASWPVVVEVVNVERLPSLLFCLLIEGLCLRGK